MLPIFDCFPKEEGKKPNHNIITYTSSQCCMKGISITSWPRIARLTTSLLLQGLLSLFFMSSESLMHSSFSEEDSTVAVATVTVRRKKALHNAEIPVEDITARNTSTPFAGADIPRSPKLARGVTR